MRIITLAFAFIFSTAIFAAEQRTVTVSVKGMVCSSCEEKITESLMKLPGVESVKANHSEGTAIVSLKPSSKTTEADIKATIKKAGFKVEG